MNVSIMQPAFLPWQGFFELVHRSDVFVLLDDAQFSVQNREHRNRLFVDRGAPGWYSLQLNHKASVGRPMNQARTMPGPWRAKLWKRLAQNYRKAPYFERYAEFLEDWLRREWESVAAQNMAFIRFFVEALGWERDLVLSSQTPSRNRRSLRVLELLREYGGDRYWSARGSFGYMREEGVFPVPGIEVYFQDFKAVPYPQVGMKEGFEPNLSALDALLNVGPRETARLCASGTRQWADWDAMLHQSGTPEAPEAPEAPEPPDETPRRKT